MHPEANRFIQILDLKAHPEGGFFKEVYRSDEIIGGECLPSRYNMKEHSYSTSIYFLLDGNRISRFHKLQSDEIWYFHSGSRGIIYILDKAGNLITRYLGMNIKNGDALQLIINKDSWFAAEVEDKTSFLLAGCMVSPGFDFDDFKLAERNELLKIFPDHEELIKKFT
jgi:predicted cupin superfamily sugar epimerase